MDQRGPSSEGVFINHSELGNGTGNFTDKSSSPTGVYQITGDSTPLFPKSELIANLAIQALSEDPRFPQVNVYLTPLESQEPFRLKALLDSGADNLYINRDWVDKHQLSTFQLEHPIPVYNADGTFNNGGTITHGVKLRLSIQGHSTLEVFRITQLKNAVIVGMEWLKKHNPEIDWIQGKIKFPRCSDQCGALKTATPENSSINELVEIPDELINEALFEQIFITETTSTRLAREALANKKVVTIEDIRNGPYAEYEDVFAEAGFKELPPHRPWDHAIDLIPDWETKRWKARLYPMSPKEKEAMDKELDELLASGRITLSKSPIASPAFFVAKKDGRLRMVIDYRKLNGITIKNAYPIPLIPELLNKWKGCVRFTKLDVRAGYHNIRISEGDEWKTAFTTHRGIYEWRVMPFGVSNAPATFQNMMNDIFITQIRAGDTEPYFDDVIIGTTPDPSGKLSFDEYHEKSVRAVLQTFRENNLYLRPEKCIFSEAAVEYLGFVISGEGVSLDPIKVAAVIDWPIPTCVKHVRQFLGFTGFYRGHVQEYSNYARPLHDLTKKDVKFEWTEACQKGFDNLKEALTKAPCLIHPDFEKPFIIEADASGTGFGAILSQEVNGKRHPIEFMTHSFNATQRNYDTHDRELLAIVEAFRKWRRYLIQSPHPTLVISDHSSLQYFRTAQDLARRHIRWAVDLSEFDIKITHRAGKKSGNVDALSRRPDFDEGKDDNKAKILLPEEWFINSVTEPSQISNLTDQIRREQLKDPLIIDIMMKDESEVTNGWEMDDKMLWRYQGKIYVPPNYRRIIYGIHHTDPTAGHAGIQPTTELIARYWYWPELKKDIHKWVQRCDSCQRYKNFPQKKPGQLHPNEIPTRPWEIVTMDLLTDLPESEGYDAILVVVDRFSKMIRLIPTNKTMDSNALLRVCWDKVWKDFGVPRIIISDRGPQFASKITRAHNKALGIDTNLSTAYHPQSDGQSERMIQEVQKTLRPYMNHYQNNWNPQLSMVEFALNNSIRSSTGYTPFYLVLGQHPNPGKIPRDLSTMPPTVEDFLSGLQKTREIAERSLHKAAEQMKKFADRKRGPTPDFEIGDKVLLDAANFPSIRPSRKLGEKRYGPFKIIKKLSDLNYQLELPDTWKIHPVFHVDKLRKYHEDPKNPNYSEPPPDLIEGEYEFEVEKILDAKWFGKGKTRHVKWLVQWKGYNSKESTWEPLSNLKNAFEVLDEFYTENPKKPKVDYRGKGKRTQTVSILTAGGSKTIFADTSRFQKPPDNDTIVTEWPGSDF